MKEGRSNFLIHLQRVQIWCWYSRSRARSAEVTWRAPGGEVMSLRSRCQRPAHIFALGDNEPIVPPDKASV